MALVRVYCGLASTDPTALSADADQWLTAAVVDDSGRLLEVCDLSDDPTGYAGLTALLTERTNNPSSVAIAADGDDHQVTALLGAAGCALAVADEDAVDDYAERFADDESIEEMESPQPERRAVGLARALQAGALLATPVPIAANLVPLKPILTAHSALATGRHAAAVALREVLRELYPAALRAYPDPAEPVALAVMDALPEPSLLTAASNGRARDGGAAEDVIARLTAAGVADAATIRDRVTSLRVAVAETSRRGGTSRALTATIAETVRQAVAAVLACDAAGSSLVTALTEQVTAPPPATSRRRTVRRTASAPPAAPLRAVRPPVSAPPSRVPAGRRARPEPVAANQPPVAPPPVTPPPVAPAPAAPPPPSRPPAPPAPYAPPPAPYAPPAAPAAAQYAPAAAPAAAPYAPPAAPYAPPAAPAAAEYAPAAAALAPPAPVAPAVASPGNRPVSVPPPPPGITPIAPAAARTAPAPARPAAHRSAPTQPDVPAEPTRPFRPTLTSAAMQGARRGAAARTAEATARTADATARTAEAGRRAQAPVAGTPRRSSPAGTSPAEPRRGAAAAAADLPRRQAAAGPTSAVPASAVPAPAAPPLPRRDHAAARSDPLAEQLIAVPAQRPVPAPVNPPPGSRSGWPTDPPVNDWATVRAPDPAPVSPALSTTGRVTPPWLADDLQPPTLRLVEPTLPPELRDDFGYLDQVRLGPPSPLPHREDHLSGAMPRSAPPVGADDDSDLLIYAATRSAWFTGHSADAPWESSMDLGWRAAEQAARPTIGTRTGVGLPRRVPQANLVPGSATLAPERPIPIVRDAATIAANTSGYFRGWRRGQEVGGFSVGSRQASEATGAWDFSRDDERDFRSADGYRR